MPDTARRPTLRPVMAMAIAVGTALATAALVLTGVVASSLGAEFVPRLDEGELSLDIKRLPSISITEAQRLGVEVEEVLARFPEVADFLGQRYALVSEGDGYRIYARREGA